MNYIPERVEMERDNRKSAREHEKDYHW